jgi:hypothetical protein
MIVEFFQHYSSSRPPLWILTLLSCMSHLHLPTSPSSLWKAPCTLRLIKRFLKRRLLFVHPDKVSHTIDRRQETETLLQCLAFVHALDQMSPCMWTNHIQQWNTREQMHKQMKMRVLEWISLSTLQKIQYSIHGLVFYFRRLHTLDNTWLRMLSLMERRKIISRVRIWKGVKSIHPQYERRRFAKDIKPIHYDHQIKLGWEKRCWTMPPPWKRVSILSDTMCMWKWSAHWYMYIF